MFVVLRRIGTDILYASEAQGRLTRDLNRADVFKIEPEFINGRGRTAIEPQMPTFEVGGAVDFATGWEFVPVEYRLPIDHRPDGPCGHSSVVLDPGTDRYKCRHCGKRVQLIDAVC